MDIRGGSRATATSKMERFVTIVNGWKPLTIITKHSILGVAAVLDLPLDIHIWCRMVISQRRKTCFYNKRNMLQISLAKTACTIRFPFQRPFHSPAKSH